MGGSTTTAKAAGLTKADQILANTHRDLIVSKRKLRQADGMALVRLQREKGDQNLCFSSRPFVLCGLPVRPLPPGQLIYERRNGHLVFRSPDIPSSVFLMVRTESCRFFSPRLRCGRSLRRSDSGVPQRRWPRSVCRRVAKNTAVSSLRLSASSARRCSSEQSR